MSMAQADSRSSAPIRAAGRWFMLGTVWLVFLVSCVDRVLWGSVSLVAGKAFGLPISGLGIFVTSFFIGYVVANVFSGLICDRIGPRLLVAGALIPMGLFTFLFGSAHSIQMGIAMQVLMGAAAAADTVAGLKLIASWFGRDERGLAMGLFLTGTSLAVTISNLLVPRLLPALDWSGVYHLFGVLTAGAGVLAAVCLRDAPSRQAIVAAKNIFDLRSLLTNRNLMLLSVAGLGALWGEWGFIYWANALMIRSAHIDPVSAGGIVALFGVGALFGKPIMGLISDRLNGQRKVPIIVLLAGFVAGLLAYGRIQNETVFWLMAPLLGIVAFAFIPLLMAGISEAVEIEKVGSATGIANALWQTGNILVPLTVGAIYQATQSFNYAFAALAIGPALGMLCMLFVREADGLQQPARHRFS